MFISCKLLHHRRGFQYSQNKYEWYFYHKIPLWEKSHANKTKPATFYWLFSLFRSASQSRGMLPCTQLSLVGWTYAPHVVYSINAHFTPHALGYAAKTFNATNCHPSWQTWNTQWTISKVRRSCMQSMLYKRRLHPRTFQYICLPPTPNVSEQEQMPVRWMRLPAIMKPTGSSSSTFCHSNPQLITGNGQMAPKA